MEHQQLLAVAAYMWTSTSATPSPELCARREYEIFAARARKAENRPTLAERISASMAAAVTAFNNPRRRAAECYE